MRRQNLKSFDELKHGDKIISPIDNEVTEFLVNKRGLKFLASNKSMWAIYQFDPADYYIYDGDKEVGEVDKEYFK